MRNISYLLVVCLTITTFSCQQSETLEKNELSSGIVLENIDSSVNPGDDFWAFPGCIGRNTNPFTYILI